MKQKNSSIAALSLLLTALGIQSAGAAFVTLTSPDNKWRLNSDEFGAAGEGVAGSITARDFGAGLTGYTWASGVMLTDGSARQALSSDTANLGLATSGSLGAANVISDSTVGSTRTSTYTVTGFANLRVTLTQSVSNSGISQNYVLSNTGASAINLSAISFRDVDLDGGTFLNDSIASIGGTLRVSEGGRDVFFSPSSVGYVGFLAGLRGGGGITGDLDGLAWTNFGIPGANLNQFREVTGGVIGANMDADSDGISDGVSDVGYLFQHNLNIPAGGNAFFAVSQLSAVPEPSAALLGLLTLGLAARRRR